MNVVNKIEGLGLACLLIACSKSPEKISQADITRQALLYRAIYFAEGGETNLCQIGNEQLGGTFVRENGKLDFYLHGTKLIINFLNPQIEDTDYPFEVGLIVHQGSRLDLNDAQEDWIAFDPAKWTTNCPTGSNTVQS